MARRRITLAIKYRVNRIQDAPTRINHTGSDNVLVSRCHVPSKSDLTNASTGRIVLTVAITMRPPIADPMMAIARSVLVFFVIRFAAGVCYA